MEKRLKMRVKDEKTQVFQERTGGGLRNCKHSLCSSSKNWQRCSTWLRRKARGPYRSHEVWWHSFPKARGSALKVRTDWSHGKSVYRLWASMRIRVIIVWREKWPDTALHGHRPRRRAEDVWMDLALSVESALVDGSDLVGMSIDWSKCFHLCFQVR